MAKLRITVLFILAAAAIDAGAWSVFGSKDGAMRNRLSSGDKLMARADEAFDKAELEKACALYQRAIKRFRDIEEIDPLFMDGVAGVRIAYCAGQWTNAVTAAEAAAAEAGGGEGGETDDGEEAEEEPDTPVLIKNAEPEPPPYDMANFTRDMSEAKMLIEDGNLSAAASLLIPMLRHDPSNREVRLLVAIVRTRQGRFDEAIVALEDMRGRREDLPVLLALSGAYAGAGRHHDALLALDGAIRLAPSDPNAYLNMAWLTLSMPADADTMRNAEMYYRQAVKRGATRDRTLEARIGLEKW